MSARGKKEVRLVLGASPRVDLLPPEVGDRKRGAALRRSVVVGVVAALILSAGLYAFASFKSVEAAVQLDSARSDTLMLLAEQAKFSEVRDLSTQLDTVTLARQVGATTEINWSTFYQSIAVTLPAGVAITAFSVDSSTPIESLTPVTVPARNPRVATALFTATSADLGSVATWLAALKNVPGYVDATVTPASINEDGVYEFVITMNVGEGAHSKRFAPPEETTSDATADDSTDGTN